MSNREVYLDSLLQSVSKPEKKEGAETSGSPVVSQTGSGKAPAARTPERKSSAQRTSGRKKTAKPTQEDDFLKSFEEEFLDLDSDLFLKEFEESLGVPQEEEETVDGLGDLDDLDEIDNIGEDGLEGFGGLNDLDGLDGLKDLGGLEGLDDMMVDTLAENGLSGSSKPAPDPKPTPEPAPQPAPAAKAEEPAADPGLLFDDLDLAGVDFEVLGGEPAPAAKAEEPAQEEDMLKEAASLLGDDTDAELIDLLAGMSGDSDIAQITDMLKAHDSDQQLFGDEMTDLDVSEGAGDELGFLDDLQAGEETGGKKKKREKKKREKKKKDKKQKKPAKKEKEGSSGGFFSKLSGTLFGPDEEEPAAAPGGKTLDGIDLENISEENRSILMEMDQEQAQKGKKKKEKKPKKEKKEKEKKPAKKKAPKPPKEKKEKKPKEKGEPIPVKPLILTTLLGVSVVVLVILGGNLLGYSGGIKAAEEAYDRGNYVEAYREIEGMEIKKGDQRFYDRVRTSAYVQKQLDFAEVYWNAGMYPEALDALCQALNRYDTFLAEAQEAGSDGELEGMYTLIEKRLSEDFTVTPEEGRQIFANEDRKGYTRKLRELVERAGLPVE